MRLQKNTRFALVSVLEAASRPGELLPAGEIARAYGISPHHLAKVLRTLARAGLVESARGVGGGYRFRGNPRRVTLMDVIELFERVGPAVEPAGRRAKGARPPADGARGASAAAIERALAAVLAETDEIAVATFRSISLATMLKLVARERRA